MATKAKAPTTKVLKKAPSRKQASEPKKLKIKYERSPHCRVIHADGAHGGPSPRGQIIFSLYSERRTIPETGTLLVSDSAPPQDVNDDPSHVLTREVESINVMELVNAVSFHAWLGRKIDECRRAAGVSDSQWADVLREVGRSRPT